MTHTANTLTLGAPLDELVIHVAIAGVTPFSLRLLEADSTPSDTTGMIASVVLPSVGITWPATLGADGLLSWELGPADVVSAGDRPGTQIKGSLILNGARVMSVLAVLS